MSLGGSLVACAHRERPNPRLGLASSVSLLYHRGSQWLTHNLRMALTISGVTVFRMGETLRRAGICRATYFRWVKAGKILDARYRDRHGRRVFTAGELQTIVEAASPQLVEADPAGRTQLKLELAG